MRSHSDGLTAVVVRTFSPGDDRLVEAMSADLSALSLYQRFLTGTPTIPRGVIRQLRTADHSRHEALLAVFAGRAVGLGQYVRDRSSTGAEVAVLVVDQWQRHGIGRLLVTQLADLAVKRGITHFVAMVQRDNTSAITAVTSYWPRAQAIEDGDHYRYEVYLAAHNA